MEFVKKYGKWILVSVLMFLFILITRELLKQQLINFDTTIYNFVSSFRTTLLTKMFKVITFMASSIFLTIITIMLFFIFKNKKYSLLSLFNLIAIVIANQTLKLIFSRPRPFEWMIVEETGYSFPSGHAMVATAFYGMLIYLIWQTKLKKKSKKIWTFLLSVLVILICISRIYLGVHYASDIIAGFTLSLSYLIIATSLISYYKNKSSKLKSR